jgi:hypothetical protein
MTATHQPRRMTRTMTREQALGELMAEALAGAAKTLAASSAATETVDVEAIPGTGITVRVWRDGRNVILDGADLLA